ncbi:MAG: tetratricopeptide repeat protein [Bacteroidetes bacterium]|nr:tetratricopeptide repeat protein [Bacteroidota bacterium]
MKRFYILILLLLNLYGWSQVKTDSLIKASFAMKNDSNKVNIYVKIARELLYTDALKALNYCDTAEILAKKLKYKRGLSKAYNAKGIYYRNISDFDNGFKYQFEAIKLAEDLKDNKLLGGAFNNLGILFKNQGNYKKSIYYLKLAHLAFGKIGDKSSQATALQNLSNTYRRAKQPDVAIVYSLQSLKIFDDLNDIFGRASAYNSLGAVYMDDKGEYNKALNYFLQAEKNCLKLNDLKVSM